MHRLCFGSLRGRWAFPFWVSSRIFIRERITQKIFLDFSRNIYSGWLTVPLPRPAARWWNRSLLSKFFEEEISNSNFEKDEISKMKKISRFRGRTIASSVADYVNSVILQPSATKEGYEKVEWVSFEECDLTGSFYFLFFDESWVNRLFFIDLQLKSNMRNFIGSDTPLVMVLGLANGYQAWVLMVCSFSFLFSWKIMCSIFSLTGNVKSSFPFEWDVWNLSNFFPIRSQVSYLFWGLIGNHF